MNFNFPGWNKYFLSAFLIATILTVTRFAAHSQITIPRFFSDHMVLKRDTSTLFWGWSKPGREVRIKAGWAKDTIRTVSTGDSKWSVVLPPAPAGGPYDIIILSDKDTARLKDILSGEVWVCSGQSNMQWGALNNMKQVIEALPGSYDDRIRFLNVRNISSPFPATDIYDQWAICDSASLRTFSAIGYFFAKELKEKLNVPIGIINSSWGGTSAEVWLPEAAVMSDKLLAEKAALQKLAPRKPTLPGRAWNSMVHPYVGYAISGALWYQGENNTVSWDGYTSLFSTLIASWRKSWNDTFPFFYAQIAPYNYKNKVIPKGALVREAQNQVLLSVPKTGMVLTSDLVNDINDIHPQLKKEVALRFADLALADYQPSPSKHPQSPVYKDFKKEGNRIIVSFHFMEGQQLTVKGSAINELYIAGADQQFVPAQYKIDGNKLIVYNKFVKDPVAIRYAFSDTAITNLYSTSGLPVSLFRTDDWEISTINNN